MNKKKSLKFNFIMNATLTMSSFIFPLITFPYVSRILLPAGTGKVSFASSFISYFAMFAQLGIPAYGIRACAKVRNNREELTRTVHELFIINIAMTVLSYIIFFIFLFTTPRLRDDIILYIIVSLSIILNTVGIEWLYKALEQYTYITIRSITFKLISAIAMFVLIHKQSDYVIYGGISVFASSASYVLNFVNVRKYIDFKNVGKYDFRKHLKPILVFFAMACATTIYTHLDTVMLGFISTDEDVGYYNAAVKIKSILVSVVTSLGAVLLPRASYYVEHNMIDEFRRVSQKVINFVFLIATPFMSYFMIFAAYGINFLSGSAYTDSILPMQIIMPTLLFIGITNITGIQILVPIGKEKVVLYSEIVGAMINLSLNAILIPIFASAGAAIGTLAAEIVVFIYQFAYIDNVIKAMFGNIHYFKIIIAVLLGFAASIWVTSLELSSFFTLAISACFFFSAYGLFLLITKEPLVVEIFNQLLGKVLKRDK